MNEQDRLDRLENELNLVKLEFARYKGFAGGVIALITAVVSFFELVLPFIRKH